MQIFYNAVVYTGDDFTNAFAVEDGRFAAIGTEALARIVNHPALRGLPFCLETPNELSGYKAEIVLMRSLFE